ncbi:uncharacterized protein V1516DRAFT_626822 [Lipomyces oligophaga]|uniref:uncharacterized protein n=1 Tax=Lipomyces oligophaga TaxID=45792 RepID=UPI0034CF1D90
MPVLTGLSRPKQTSLSLRSECFQPKRMYQHWYDKRPPSRRSRWTYKLQRYFYDFKSLSFAQVCFGLIAVFVGVYVLKTFVPGFPSLYYTRNSSVFKAVTSMFDHSSIMHLFSNSLYLYGLAMIAPYGMSAPATLVVFIVGGLGGLFLSELSSRLREDSSIARHDGLRARYEHYRHVQGSSAAIWAISSVVTLIDPRRGISLYGLIPLPIWALTGGLLAYDLIGCAREYIAYKHNTTPPAYVTDHTAHLGGALTGAICFVVMRRFRRGIVYW